jgi:hypothetical protein
MANVTLVLSQRELRDTISTFSFSSNQGSDVPNSVVTNVDGKCSLEWHGKPIVVFTSTAFGFASACIKSRDERRTLVLQQWSTVELRVNDEPPTPGADRLFSMHQVIPVGGDRFILTELWKTTNQNGMVTFSKLGPGPACLSEDLSAAFPDSEIAARNVLRRWTQRLDVYPGEARKLSLQDLADEGCEVTGALGDAFDGEMFAVMSTVLHVSHSGVPLRDTLAQYSSRNDSPQYCSRVTSDGRFDFDRVTPGTYLLFFYRLGKTNGSNVEESAPLRVTADRTRIELGTLKGKVLWSAGDNGSGRRIREREGNTGSRGG